MQRNVQQVTNCHRIVTAVIYLLYVLQSKLTDCSKRFDFDGYQSEKDTSGELIKLLR